MAFILPTIICPACGFDPYDMIFYAVKQEFPDRNPRDVIEEMSDEEYKEEAEFYVFENHIDYCPNQDKLMKISAGFETEEEAFAYAYNQGHAASRKNTAYKPNPTGKDTMDFKKIFKQRAESAGKKSCSDCSQDEEDGYTISTCYDCGEEFCEDCFCSDCDNCDDDCTCKCVECGDKDSYKYELADGGNVCRDCGSRCDECEKTFLRDEVKSNDINHKYYCDSCRDDKGECHICEDILIYYENDNGSCEVCQENVCSECSSETEDPEKPGYVGHDVACDNCVKEKKLVVNAETFEAPYAGAGSLMGIGQGTGLGSFTSKELTESSAIHGDFDSASLNYSGKQNLEVRAEADAKQTPFVWCVVRAFDEDDGSGVGEVENTEVLGVFKYKKDADKAMKSVYNEMKSQGLEEDYDKDGFYTDNGFIHTTKSKLGQLWMPYGAYRFWNAESFEADWRDLPRDSAGRWMSWTSFTPTSEEPENLDAYIDIQPAQSGTFPLPVEKQETFSESQITLRELSETMNALTGNLLGFDMAYRTVLDMLGSQDSPERREALLSTMEETIMTLEFYEETDYDGDIQMMVDIMRQNGMNPPPQFEEEVLARYQFEDKWAAEDKKILKPEVPADYNINQTFGNNMVLMAEDSGNTSKPFFWNGMPKNEFITKSGEVAEWMMQYEYGPTEDWWVWKGDGPEDPDSDDADPDKWGYVDTGAEGRYLGVIEFIKKLNGYSYDEVLIGNLDIDDKFLILSLERMKGAPSMEGLWTNEPTISEDYDQITFDAEEEDRNSPAFEKWEEKFYLCYHDWQDDELHVDTFDEKYQITAYCSLCDATMLLTNLNIGDNGPDVFELPGRRPLLDFYDTSQEAYAAEEEMIKVSATLSREFWLGILMGDDSINEVDWEIESADSSLMHFGSEDDEGPTIEEFFRDISKVLNKYGEFSWDSEAGEEGLYFSGMLLPNNGADNFFQYDEDFSE